MNRETIHARQLKVLDKLSPMGQLIQIVLMVEGEKYFGTKANTNEARTYYLSKNEDFNCKINLFKEKFIIPKLSIKKDNDTKPVTVGYKTRDVEISHWIESQPEDRKVAFGNFIYDLLESFNLPIYFYDWTEKYILYGDPNFIPIYNWQIIDLVIRHPEQIERFELTTREKKFIKFCFKEIVYSKLPRKEAKSAYKELQELLRKSKNTKRRFKSFKTATQIEHKNKPLEQIDPYTLQTIKRKPTSSDLATIVLKDDTGKKASLIRKIQQRSKEYEKDLFKQN